MTLNAVEKVLNPLKETIAKRRKNEKQKNISRLQLFIEHQKAKKGMKKLVKSKNLLKKPLGQDTKKLDQEKT